MNAEALSAYRASRIEAAIRAIAKARAAETSAEAAYYLNLAALRRRRLMAA